MSSKPSHGLHNNSQMAVSAFQKSAILSPCLSLYSQASALVTLEQIHFAARGTYLVELILGVYSLFSWRPCFLFIMNSVKSIFILVAVSIIVMLYPTFRGVWTFKDGYCAAIVCKQSLYRGMDIISEFMYRLSYSIILFK